MPHESLPEEVAEIPVEKAIRGSVFSRDRLVVGFLVLTQIGFVLVFFQPDAPRISEHFLLGTAGVLLSQPFLLAFWAAFGQQHFFQRLLWCFFLCTLLFCSEAAINLRHKNLDAGIIMMVAQFGFFFLAGVIFLIIRKLSGWRIQKADNIAIDSDYRATQFGIKHLIVLTAITALAAGLFRSLYLFAPFHIERIVQVTGEIGTYFILLLPPFILPWYTLAHRPRIVSLIVFSILLFVVMNAVTYYALKYYYVRLPGDFNKLLSLQLGAALSILFTTLPLRFCGYRMVRLRKQFRIGPADRDAS